MKRDTLIFLPSKILEGLIGIGTLSYMARALSGAAVDDFGTVNTVVLFAYLLLAGWISNAMARYIGDESGTCGGSAFFTTGTAVWLSMMLLGWCAALTARAVSGSALWLYAAVMLTSTSIYQIVLGMLVQTGRRFASVALSLTSAAVKPAVIFLFCTFWPAGTGSALPAVAGYASAELIAGLCGAALLHIPGALRRGRFSAGTARLFFGYGFPLIGVSLSLGLLNLVDRFIIILFGTDFNVYYMNNTISSSVFSMLMLGVMRGVYPSVLRGYREGGRAEAKTLLNAGVRLYLLIALPAAAGLAGVGADLSLFLFGPDYASSAAVIGLSAFASFFTGLTEYAIKTWELSGDTRPIMQNALLSVVVKIVLSLALLPTLGITGAALASLLAFALYFVVSALRARKTLLFSVPPARLARIGGASAACFAVSALVCAAVPSPLGSLAAAIPAGALAYGAVLLLTGEIRGELAALTARLKARRP